MIVKPSWHVFCKLLKDQESFSWFSRKVCGVSKNWLGNLIFGSILQNRKTFEIVLPWSDCWLWIKSLGICCQQGFMIWLELTCYSVSEHALFFLNSAMTDRNMHSFVIKAQSHIWPALPVNFLALRVWEINGSYDNNREGMTIIQKEWQYSEGMTLLWKKWQ